MQELVTLDADQALKLNGQFVLVAIEAAGFIGANLNIVEGALAAQKAAAGIINLGLGYLAESLHRGAADILAKNDLNKVYLIGLKLIVEAAVRAKPLLDKNILSELRGKRHYGILSYAIEHLLTLWSRLEPCASLTEYRERMRVIEEAERLMVLARHFPTSLIVGHEGLPVAKGHEFARECFRRPSRSEPCVHGGILEPLVWTLMIKCVMGGYVRCSYRSNFDREGLNNWVVTRKDILDFARLATGDADALNRKIERAMENMDAFFSEDARLMFAAKMKGDWQDKWGAELQSIFLRLAAAVREFYSCVPEEITAADIDAFWASRVVVDTEHGTSLHENQVPRIESLLDHSIESLLEILVGFRIWPEELRRKFASRYQFTDRLIIRDKACDFSTAGAEMAAVIRLISPIEVNGSVTGSRELMIAGSVMGMEYAETAVRRLDLSRLTARLIYGLHTSAPAWVQAELLRRIDECRLTAKSLVAIVRRGDSKSPEADKAWFAMALRRLMETEDIGDGNRQTWIDLMAMSPRLDFFPAVINCCPEKLFAQTMRRVATNGLRHGLQQLTFSELLRTARVVGVSLPTDRADLPGSDDMISMIIAAIGYRRT
jgi:hypothetical protein